jgi:hypothetical protein
VEDVLHALHDDRAALARDVDEPLHPQQVGTAHRREQLHRGGERLPRERLLEPEHERPDRAVVRAGREALAEITIHLAGTAQPALELSAVGPRGAQPDVEEERRFDLALDRCGKLGARVQRAQPRAQCFDLRRAREIGLREQQSIRDGRLLDRLGLGVELARAVHRVHEGHDAVEPVLGRKQRIGREGLDDRRGIGETGGLDDDAIEVDHFAGAALREQLAQRLLQIGAHGAAEAAVREQRDVLGGRSDERIVDADFAELVDHHRDPVHARMREQPPDQRRLAAAEEARDDRHRETAGERVACAQIVISSTYSPPANRSTVKTKPRSSTYTSFSWIAPTGESFGAPGTKYAISWG